MAIYCEYEGIKGNVTADGYKDHFAIQALHFGCSRGITMEPGNLANRECTKPSLSEVTITKLADNSVTSLFQEAVAGQGGSTVKFKFCQTGTDKVIEYLDIELTNALVSSYSVSCDAEGDPVETICLSFSKIMVNYSDYDTTNKNSNPQRIGYDLEKAKKV